MYKERFLKSFFFQEFVFSFFYNISKDLNSLNSSAFQFYPSLRLLNFVKL